MASLAVPQSQTLYKLGFVDVRLGVAGLCKAKQHSMMDLVCESCIELMGATCCYCQAAQYFCKHLKTLVNRHPTKTEISSSTFQRPVVAPNITTTLRSRRFSLTASISSAADTAHPMRCRRGGSLVLYRRWCEVAGMVRRYLTMYSACPWRRTVCPRVSLGSCCPPYCCTWRKTPPW